MKWPIFAQETGSKSHVASYKIFGLQYCGVINFSVKCEETRKY